MTRHVPRSATSGRKCVYTFLFCHAHHILDKVRKSYLKTPTIARTVATLSRAPRKAPRQLCGLRYRPDEASSGGRAGRVESGSISAAISHRLSQEGDHRSRAVCGKEEEQCAMSQKAARSGGEARGACSFAAPLPQGEMAGGFVGTVSGAATRAINCRLAAGGP